MEKLALPVKKEFCAECSLALRRFIGNMHGVNSVNTGDGLIVIDFDSTKIDKTTLVKIADESLDKLGYKIRE